VLRVLGNLLAIDGFDFNTSEAVRDAALGAGIDGKLNNAIGEIAMAATAFAGGLQRIADVPIHFSDALVRHAESLQATRDAQTPKAWMTSAQLRATGVEAGGRVRVRQDSAEVVLEAAIDEHLPAGCIRVAAGHPATAGLGAMCGAIAVEKA